MATTTTNFGWDIPQSTDLVKDGATAIATLGQDIDTALVDLKGGTTGQILSKNSATDLDFVWINNDQGDITGITATSPLTGGGTSGAVTVGIQDGTTLQKGAVQLENSTSSTSTTTAAVPASVKSAYDLANAAIPKSTVTTNGDIIYATGSSTVTRLGIGSSGQVLNVSGGVPAWTTLSTGAYTSLATGSLSGGAVSIDSISGSYNDLILIIRGFRPSTDDVALNGRINNDTSSIYTNVTNLASSGLSASNTSWNNVSYNADNGTSQSFIRLDFYDYANTSTWKTARWWSFTNDATTTTNVNYTTARAISRTTSAISSIQLFCSSGNFAAGSYILYGVK